LNLIEQTTDIAPDLNWLFSTIVQSAAALVAIVAGFIVSRLLALSAELSTIRSRLRDVDLQLKSKQEEYANIEDRILRRDARSFVGESLFDFVKSRGDLDLHEAIRI